MFVFDLIADCFFLFAVYWNCAYVIVLICFLV